MTTSCHYYLSQERERKAVLRKKRNSPRHEIFSHRALSLQISKLSFRNPGKKTFGVSELSFFMYASKNQTGRTLFLPQSFVPSRLQWSVVAEEENRVSFALSLVACKRVSAARPTAPEPCHDVCVRERQGRRLREREREKKRAMRCGRARGAGAVSVAYA
jgi:hypothetical protein